MYLFQLTNERIFLRFKFMNNSSEKFSTNAVKMRSKLCDRLISRFYFQYLSSATLLLAVAGIAQIRAAIPEGCFIGTASALECLRQAENELTEITMSGIGLYRIEEQDPATRQGIFARFQSLTTLDLSNNFIQHLSFRVFRGSLNIRTLRLTGNQITTFEHIEEIPLLMPHLTELFLSGNPVNCNCSVNALFQLQERQRLIRDAHLMHCASPLEWKGLPFSQMPVHYIYGECRMQPLWQLCGKINTNKQLFPCFSGPKVICIPRQNVCDGINQCPDSSRDDENVFICRRLIQQQLEQQAKQPLTPATNPLLNNNVVPAMRSGVGPTNGGGISGVINLLPPILPTAASTPQDVPGVIVGASAGQLPNSLLAPTIHTKPIVLMNGIATSSHNSHYPHHYQPPPILGVPSTSRKIHPRTGSFLPNDALPLQPTSSPPPSCSAGFVVCGLSSSTCVPLQQFCNGVSDCPNGFDEMQQNCQTTGVIINTNNIIPATLPPDVVLIDVLPQNTATTSASDFANSATNSPSSPTAVTNLLTTPASFTTVSELSTPETTTATLLTTIPTLHSSTAQSSSSPVNTHTSTGNESTSVSTMEIANTTTATFTTISSVTPLLMVMVNSTTNTFGNVSVVTTAKPSSLPSNIIKKKVARLPTSTSSVGAKGSSNRAKPTSILSANGKIKPQPRSSNNGATRPPVSTNSISNASVSNNANDLRAENISNNNSDGKLMAAATNIKHVPFSFMSPMQSPSAAMGPNRQRSTTLKLPPNFVLSYQPADPTSSIGSDGSNLQPPHETLSANSNNNENIDSISLTASAAIDDRPPLTPVTPPSMMDLPPFGQQPPYNSNDNSNNNNYDNNAPPVNYHQSTISMPPPKVYQIYTEPTSLIDGSSIDAANVPPSNFGTVNAEVNAGPWPAPSPSEEVPSQARLPANIRQPNWMGATKVVRSLMSVDDGRSFETTEAVTMPPLTTTTTTTPKPTTPAKLPDSALKPADVSVEILDPVGQPDRLTVHWSKASSALRAAAGYWQPKAYKVLYCTLSRGEVVDRDMSPLLSSMVYEYSFNVNSKRSPMDSGPHIDAVKIVVQALYVDVGEQQHYYESQPIIHALIETAPTAQLLDSKPTAAYVPPSSALTAKSGLPLSRNALNTHMPVNRWQNFSNIVGLSVGGALLGVMAIGMIMYFVRRRPIADYWQPASMMQKNAAHRRTQRMKKLKRASTSSKRPITNMSSIASDSIYAEPDYSGMPSATRRNSQNNSSVGPSPLASGKLGLSAAPSSITHLTHVDSRSNLKFVGRPNVHSSPSSARRDPDADGNASSPHLLFTTSQQHQQRQLSSARSTPQHQQQLPGIPIPLTPLSSTFQMPPSISTATHHQQLNAAHSLRPFQTVSQHRPLAIDHSYLQVVDDSAVRPTFYFANGSQSVSSYNGATSFYPLPDSGNVVLPQQPTYDMSTLVSQMNRQHQHADGSALNSETYYYVLAPQPHGTPVLQPCAHHVQHPVQIYNGGHPQGAPVIASPAFYAQQYQQQQRGSTINRGAKVDPYHDIDEVSHRQPSSSSSVSNRRRRRRQSTQRSSTSSTNNTRNGRNNNNSVARNEFDEEFDDEEDEADEELERCVGSDAARRQQQPKVRDTSKNSQQSIDFSAPRTGYRDDATSGNDVRADSRTSSKA